MLQSFLIKLQKDKLQIEVFKNVGLSFLVKIASMTVGLIMQLVMVRIMGATQYGIYTFVWAIFLTLIIVSKMGFELASIRIVAQYRSSEQWELLKGFLYFSHGLVVATSVLLIVAIFFVIKIVSIGHQTGTEWAEVLLLASALIPFYSLMELQAGILRGLNRLTQSIILPNVLYPLLVSLFAVVFSFSSILTAKTVIFVLLLANICTLGVQIYFIVKVLPKNILSLAHQYKRVEWFQTSSAMMVSNGLEQAVRQLDVLVIGTIAGTTASGVYDVAARFAKLVVLGLQISNQSTAHMFAPLYLQRKKVELQRVVSLTSIATMLTTVPLVAVLFFAPSWFLSFFGEIFSDQGRLILQTLLVGQLVNALVGPNGMLMNMTAYQNEVMWISIGTLVLQVCTLIAVVPRMGILGVAVARSTAIVFRNIVLTQRVQHHMEINTTVFTTHLWKVWRTI